MNQLFTVQWCLLKLSKIFRKHVRPPQLVTCRTRLQVEVSGWVGSVVWSAQCVSSLSHHLQLCFQCSEGFYWQGEGWRVHVPWQRSSTCRCDPEVSSCTPAADEHVCPAAPPSGTTSLRKQQEHKRGCETFSLFNTDAALNKHIGFI